MYASQTSWKQDGKTWNVLVPLLTPADPSPDKASFMDQPDKGKKVKYRRVRHVKAASNCFAIDNDEWTSIGDPATTRLISGYWESPKSKAGRINWFDAGSSYLPAVPKQHADRTNDTIVTSVNHGSYYRDKLDSLSNWTYWVSDVGVNLACLSRFDPQTGLLRQQFWYTNQRFVTINSARRIPYALTMGDWIFNSILPYEARAAESQLTPSVIEQMHAANINQFEFIQNPNLAKDVIDLGRAALTLDADNALKEIASLYLGYKFGASSTARDYADLASSIAKATERVYQARKYRDRKVHSRSSSSISWKGFTWRCNHFLTAYLDNFDQGIMGLMNGLDSWGFYPDRAAVWELVPFSFVVDWFVNVQENLERRDAQFWREYYNVHAAILATKMETDFSIEDLNPNSLVHGSVTISLYDRRVERSLPSPEIDFDLSLPKGVHAWVTSAALVIQRRG